MKYKKYNLGKYNLHIIKTDKFKTITIKINFKRKIKKDELTKRTLLVYTMFNSSLKFPTKRTMGMEIENLYGISLNGENYLSGNYSILSFSSTFLNEKYTEKGLNNKSLDFILELILNPNIRKKEFSYDSFKLAYNTIKDEIKTFKDYPNSYSKARLLENINKKQPFSYRVMYNKDLNQINAKDLAKYYYDVLENDIIDIAIIGNIDFEETKKYFEKNFIREKNNITSESHFIIYNKIRKEEKTVVEKMNINQSKLLIGCNFESLTDYELKYVLPAYSYILGGGADSLLFSEVREKNSLCYSIQASYNLVSGMLIISAGIDGKNFKKTVSLIKEQINKIKKGNFSDDLIENGKKIFENSCIATKDSQNSLLNIYLSHEYLNTDLLDERIDKMNQCTKERVMALANKMHIDTIYLLEGE